MPVGYRSVKDLRHKKQQKLFICQIFIKLHTKQQQHTDKKNSGQEAPYQPLGLTSLVSPEYN